MGVYFRTGDRSGVGVSWWFYLCVILPMQLLYLFVKSLIVVAVFVGGLAVAAVHAVRDRRHGETAKNPTRP